MVLTTDPYIYIYITSPLLAVPAIKPIIYAFYKQFDQKGLGPPLPKILGI